VCFISTIVKPVGPLSNIKLVATSLVLNIKMVFKLNTAIYYLAENALPRALLDRNNSKEKV
jgi:hypothetical protein